MELVSLKTAALANEQGQCEIKVEVHDIVLTE